jgi:hypothetical protein
MTTVRYAARRWTATQEGGDVARRFGGLLGGLLVMVLLGSACGGGTPAITLDPPPSTSSTVPAFEESSRTSSSRDDETGRDDGEPDDEPDDGDDVVVGREWVDATANLEGIESYCGNLAFVSAHPERDEVYTGVSGQGLFVNRPDSPEWAPFGRDGFTAPLDHRTSAIVYDPEDPDRFWESGYFGLGPPPDPQAADINRTDDGGETFIGLGSPVPTDLVSVDFTDPERRTLLAGAHGQPTIFRSTDGGLTWEDISADLPTSDLGEASYPHVLDAETYLVGAHKGGAAGVFRTSDGGTTWSRVFPEPVSGPPLASQDGNLYWVVEQGGIIKSEDLGETWVPLTDRAPAGGERRGRIVELDDGTWLTMGVERMLVSRDQGENWRGVGPPFAYAPKGFTYSPVRNQVFAWQNYCDLDNSPNPVAPQSIIRLDLDVTPG